MLIPVVMVCSLWGFRFVEGAAIDYPTVGHCHANTNCFPSSFSSFLHWIFLFWTDHVLADRSHPDWILYFPNCGPSMLRMSMCAATEARLHTWAAVKKRTQLWKRWSIHTQLWDQRGFAAETCYRGSFVFICISVDFFKLLVGSALSAVDQLLALGSLAIDSVCVCVMSGLPCHAVLIHKRMRTAKTCIDPFVCRIGRSRELRSANCSFYNFFRKATSA